MNINRHSLEQDFASTLDPQFVKPDYSGYCFSNISPTIEEILTGGKAQNIPAKTRLPSQTNFVANATPIEHVITLFFDGFGWKYFQLLQDYIAEHPTFRCGTWSKLTAQFPSTTAAHVTNLYTGLTPQESGVYEWFYYEPKIDRVIAPLLFSEVPSVPGQMNGSVPVEVKRDSLHSLDVNVSALLPTTFLSSRLAAKNVDMFIYGDRTFTPSTYTSAIGPGATLVPFSTVKEALSELKKHIADARRKSYHVLYFNSFDSMCHKFGADSELAIDEARRIISDLEESFLNTIAENTEGSVLINLIADHGHRSISHETTRYLDLEIPDLLARMKNTGGGVPMAPCGSPNDLFLHIKDEFLPATINELSDHLTGVARVFATATLLDEGYFGLGEPAESFRAKCGNIVVLPYSGHSVWLSLGGIHNVPVKGNHGGLTAEEMEIPFWCLRGDFK